VRSRPAVLFVQDWSRLERHEPDVLKYCAQNQLSLVSLCSDSDELIKLAKSGLIEAVVAVVESSATATLGLVVGAFGVPLYVLLAGRRTQPHRRLTPVEVESNAAILAAAARGASPAEIAKVLGVDLGQVSAMLSPVAVERSGDPRRRRIERLERPSERRPEPFKGDTSASTLPHPREKRPRRVR